MQILDACDLLVVNGDASAYIIAKNGIERIHRGVHVSNGHYRLVRTQIASFKRVENLTLQIREAPHLHAIRTAETDSTVFGDDGVDRPIVLLLPRSNIPTDGHIGQNQDGNKGTSKGIEQAACMLIIEPRQQCSPPKLQPRDHEE